MSVSIDSMDGYAFEAWCANLLRKSGFSNVRVTQGSGDQGVDVLAERDGVKYAFQCKRYEQKVGNKAVQEIYAGKAMYNCDVAVVITNNYFTEPAKELARKTRVQLWDRAKVFNMAKTAGIFKQMGQENGSQQNYEKHKKQFRLTGLLGVFMCLSALICFFSIEKEFILQGFYVFMFFLGGVCNILDVKGTSYAIKACIFYAISTFLSAIINIFDGFFCPVFIMPVALSISAYRTFKLQKGSGKNSQ